jgi:hypothetical protein
MERITADVSQRDSLWMCLQWKPENLHKTHDKYKKSFKLNTRFKVNLNVKFELQHNKTSYFFLSLLQYFRFLDWVLERCTHAKHLHSKTQIISGETIFLANNELWQIKRCRENDQEWREYFLGRKSVTCMEKILSAVQSSRLLSHELEIPLSMNDDGGVYLDFRWEISWMTLLVGASRLSVELSGVLRDLLDMTPSRLVSRDPTRWKLRDTTN